jgi:hypothetical protein
MWPNALCLLKTIPNMHRAHGAPDAQSDAHGNALDAHGNALDAHGNALDAHVCTVEDLMAYAILGSLDVDRFKEILSEPTSAYHAKERLQDLGPHQKMMYNMMETHFKQRAAQPPPIAPEQLIAPEQDEAGARAGSARARARAVAPEQDEASARAGSARAAGKAPASASAGATRQLKRSFVDDYDMRSADFDPAATDAASSAPRKTKTKVREAEFEEIFSISKLGDPAHARKMKTFYEENGILCIDLENKINKHKAVREFVTCLFRQMPYRDEFLLNFKLANGKELHINNDEDVDAIVDVLLEKKINQENLNRLKKCLPPHASFGAPCTPP